MGLPEHVIKHAPKESWWLQPNRESFQKARDDEAARMRNMGVYQFGGFDSESQASKRMSRPTNPRQTD
jgi:hypothetical protein